MIKVLHFVATLGTPGGVQSLLKNYYERMDHDKIQFDFAVFDDTDNGFKKYFTEMGCNIFYIPPKKAGILAHIKAIDDLLKNEKYDIVHTHQNFRGALTIWIAKRRGVPVRIVQSHRSNAPESTKVRIIRFFMTKWIKRESTEWWACGRDAAKWLFGEKDSQDVYILNNAIDVRQFNYDLQTRQQLRDDLGLTDSFVVGNVGRFYSPKNHKLLVEVFAELLLKVPEAKLLLVGEGELEQAVRQQVKELGIEDSVVFTGARSDVYRYLQAMDVFVLTSTFEGLPVVLVEAQSAGLPCVTSKRVTDEVAVTDLVNYLEKDATVSEWVEGIIKSRRIQRKSVMDAMMSSNFYILKEAKKLELKYEMSLNK